MRFTHDQLARALQRAGRVLVAPSPNRDDDCRVIREAGGEVYSDEKIARLLSCVGSEALPDDGLFDSIPAKCGSPKIDVLSVPSTDAYDGYCGGDLKGFVTDVFRDMTSRLPVDYIVTNRAANCEFIARCRAAGAGVSEAELNWALLNARKAGLHRGIQTQLTQRLGQQILDRIGYGSEMAARAVQELNVIEQGEVVTLDRILCNPRLRARFDEIAAELAPGGEPEQYRAIALSHRKAGGRASARAMASIVPNLQNAVRRVSFGTSRFPESPAFYCFYAESTPLFLDYTDNLQSRVEQHLSVCGGHLLPSKIGVHSERPTSLKWCSAPAEWGPAHRSEVAYRCKRERMPWLNYLGKLERSGAA